MEFSSQGYWSGLPFPSPGDLPNPGLELGSPVLQVYSLPAELPGKHHLGSSKSNVGDAIDLPVASGLKSVICNLSALSLAPLFPTSLTKCVTNTWVKTRDLS